LERKRLKDAALLEVLRLIREEEPPKPSLRLSSTEELPSIAANRGLEPKKLNGVVRGELDWIVMKALEKDRNRRYETANGFAMDVQRYLADDAVLACPPSAAYRLRKFTRKNRKVLMTAAAFVLLLAAAALVSTWQAILARQAVKDSKEANIVADDARNDALSAKTQADEQRDEARRSAYITGIGLAQRAWDEGNVDRARELLNETPQDAGGRNLRGFEYYYLSRLFRADEQTFGHSQIVAGEIGVNVAFSPDGRRVASGTAIDGTLKVWELTTGKELFSVKAHPGMNGVRSVAFSPDGTRVASGGDDSRPREKSTIKIWDAQTGHFNLKLEGPSMVTAVAWSPDGLRLASVSTPSAAGTMQINGASGRVKELEAVQLWEVATGKALFSRIGTSARSVAFSGDGRRFVTGGQDGTVRIWEAHTGKEQISLKAHLGDVKSVAFGPDGQIVASAGFDGTVRLWESATGKELISLRCSSNVESIAFSPDGRWLASAADTVKIWEVATGQELFSLKGHSRGVESVAFSRDGQHLASGGNDDTVKVWQVATSKERLTLKGHSHQIMDVAFSPDGQRLVSGSNDETVLFWEVATGKVVSSLQKSEQRIALSPNGEILASYDPFGPVVQLWEVATGKQMRALPPHPGGCRNLVFSPDGRHLATGSRDGMARIWDLATGNQLFVKGIPAAASKPNDAKVAFSPDGLHLASSWHDGTVIVWQAMTGEEVFRLNGHSGFLDVMFSPDGKRLARLAFDAMEFWEAATGKEMFSIKGNYRCGVFSPDSRRLALGNADGTVRLLESASGKELLSLKAQSGAVNVHNSEVTGLAFSPDGRRLAAGKEDGTITIWETVDISYEDEKLRAACVLVNDLFQKHCLRDDVIDYLQKAHGMDEAYRQAAITIAQSHPENMNALWVQTGRFIEQAQWHKVAAHFLRMVELQPDSLVLYYWLALVQVGAGDLPGYRKTCGGMLDRFRLVDNPEALNQISWTSVLAPEAGIDLQQVVKMADLAVQADPKNLQYCTTLGSSLYRAGRFDDAIKRLTEVSAAWEQNQANPPPTSPAYTWFFLAMAQQRTRHAKEARESLDKAINWTEKETQNKVLAWNRRLSLQLLRREAEFLIKGPPLFPIIVR
jgi:WD40 repeat protein